jgi:hypothetical protein
MPLSNIYTAAGAKVFIAPSQAATPADATAYAGLTWTEIKGLQTIGEYGDESAAVTGAIIGDARTRKAKGARDAGTLALTAANWPDDPGQAALVAAEATNNNYPFKIVVPNRVNASGTDGIDYMVGLVMSKRLNLGSNDTIVTRTFSVAVNSAITEVPPTAGA